MALKRHIFVVLIVQLMFSPVANGGEFGNFFFKGKEQNSINASAKALQGIESVVSAIRLRELKKFGEGDKALDSAVGSLKEASGMIEKIEIGIGEDKEIPWNKIPNHERNIVLSMNGILNHKGLPNKISELLKMFSESTYHLANTISQNLKKGPEPIFPQISPEFSLYLRFGGAISDIARISMA